MDRPSRVFTPISLQMSSQVFILLLHSRARVIWPSVWPVPLSLPPSLDTSGETDIRYAGLLDC